MNIYVGNIAAAVNPAELQQIFAGMGQVLYAKLAEKEEVGETGFAFVYVPNEERARDAVATLNGTVLKGEKLTVQKMSERPGVVGGEVKQ